MSILSREELTQQLNTLIGENNSDQVIKFLEDYKDTMDNYETLTNDTTDWKHKYQENDEQWRTKYRERFFQGNAEDDDKNKGKKEDDDGSNKPLTYENLFKGDK